ncbi:threonine--tRNA ligase [Candidatus Peregrinibacteria bacterium]|nr:threonine--tRNA ligase [Candidatus Peregrinibacteria bacterium]
MAKKTSAAPELEKMRHSASHVLAQAVLEMFPEAKLGVGPAIENGFYYDFDLPRTLIPEDLPLLEKKMQHIVKQNMVFKLSELPVDDAIKILKDANQKYKVEMALDLKKEGIEKITFYENIDQNGKRKFIDMCEGPHVEKTGKVGAFKLTHIAGAYWRGDEKNPMLQRIYGVCFETKQELDDYLKKLEEAKRRDHRKLGQELELFTFDDEVGAGLPLWLPRGAYLRNRIMEFAFNTYLKNGYDPVVSPHIGNAKLWGHSGHLDFYKESMYGPMMIEEEEYRIKPMNCPFHVKMYKSKMHSYRELPCRWTEMGTVYRYERSGTLHGLTRVRGFTQDDAHIICRPDQLKQEIAKALELTLFILNKFGFNEFEMNVSVRDPENKSKFIGEDDRWETAEQVLKEVLNESGFKDYVYDIGGAVFYGPKIDVKVSDSIGRKWQLSTIQFDFNLPTKFGMTYIGEDGKEHTPFMIHRALLGSLERFIGVLIEHYAGAFPAWLSYYPVALLPVAAAHEKYAEKVKEDLWKQGIRAEIYAPTDTLGKRIREAELKKTPYMAVIGDKEVESKSLAIRNYSTKKQETFKTAEFIKSLVKEIG